MSLDDPNSPKAVESAAAPAPLAAEAPKPAAPPAPAAPTVPPQIQDFDALINKDVQNFVELGDKIGGLVGEQVGSSCLGCRQEHFADLPIVESGLAGLQGGAHLPLRFDKGEETGTAAPRAHDGASQCVR